MREINREMEGEDRTCFILLTHSEVETTVDNDTNNGRNETTVETSDTIGSQSLPVNID